MLRSSAQNPSFWKLQLLGWGSFYGWGLLGALPTFLAEPKALCGHTLTDSFILLGSLSLHPVCRRLLLRSRSLLFYEASVACVAALIASVTTLATGYLLAGCRLPDWPMFIPIYMESTFTLFMWGTLYFTVKQWQHASKERERLLQAESQAREARLQALRYQLDPHFLFNSLNAVSTLVLDGRTDAATQMLSQIGDVLRRSLDVNISAEVTLSQELAFTEAYLAIEQTRLGDRLSFEVAIAPETLNALVPSMLLQPLVENAIRYGFSPRTRKGFVTIRSVPNGEHLQITISNSGPRQDAGLLPQGNGIGLRNTAERLRTLYGIDQKFLMRWPEDGGCTVTLEIPYRPRC